VACWRERSALCRLMLKGSRSRPSLRSVRVITLHGRLLTFQQRGGSKFSRSISSAPSRCTGVELSMTAALTGTLPRIELPIGDPGQSGIVSFFVDLRRRLRIGLLASLRTPMPLPATHATATGSPAIRHLGQCGRGTQYHHRDGRYRRNQPFRPIEAHHRYPSTEPSLTVPRFGATGAPVLKHETDRHPAGMVL
jgi:hypothetical protein